MPSDLIAPLGLASVRGAKRYAEQFNLSSKFVHKRAQGLGFRGIRSCGCLWINRKGEGGGGRLGRKLPGAPCAARTMQSTKRAVGSKPTTSGVLATRFEVALMS